MSTGGEAAGGVARGRDLLGTLEGLLGIDAFDLRTALAQASQRIAEALGADKVDVFLHEAATDSLVAVGTSDTPMSRKQRALGLDRLPLANGGRIVDVYRTGRSYLSGHADADPEEVRGLSEGLGIRSNVGAALSIGPVRRGVLMVSSGEPERFTQEDLAFVEASARWIGTVAHRAELLEELTRAAAARGRRAAAEELITVLAHDLRNHLAPLAMRLGVMRRRAARDGRQADLREAERAEAGLTRLTRLIDDLLDVARLDEGLLLLERQPVDLVVLVQDVIQAFATPASSFEVSAPEELIVQADANRIRQVLENLVSNAQRYSPPGVPVAVEVRAEERGDGQWAIVAVIDRGPGIAPELLPQIFDRYRKSRVSPGLGLGLHLASRIAEAHGGTLRAQSELGKGARFELALPCGRA